MQFVQWLSVDGILIYFRNLCMGLHFHGFMWPVRKDFGKKPLVCCKWEESSKSAFLSCRHYVGFQLKLMTKPFVITHRIFPWVRQGLPFWTGKSFLQAGVRNGCRCGAVNFCSNIWTRWPTYILRNSMALKVITDAWKCNGAFCVSLEPHVKRNNIRINVFHESACMANACRLQQQNLLRFSCKVPDICVRF